ncbi:SIP domain-containing protein [Deminuibacter soli]|uniref:FAD-binding FR-type domain-containing protein n=1 Tax=Deminuibacter soli TaxID=2291815 RepID=A0A3E1NKX6_9BACT|nr:siderophore-interacting protein [Deminuibacter soli]RFM28585.1 hypothetical protein DXN05_07240 [Deminuibacter soli]
MFNIKQKAIALIENRVGKTGRVLGVRHWEPGGFVEIDLHLPDIDMYRFSSVQHIKCRVAPAQYRDYTIAGWDAETHTCTLYIHTAHAGAGSNWANNLEEGDEIVYLGVSGSVHSATERSTLLCLGDASTIGHYWALQQLAHSGRANLCGAIALDHEAYCGQLNDYLRMNVQPLLQTDAGGETVLLQWMQQELLKRQHEDVTVYVAGYSPAVATLRRQLRSLRYGGALVKAQAFWS